MLGFPLTQYLVTKLPDCSHYSGMLTKKATLLLSIFSLPNLLDIVIVKIHQERMTEDQCKWKQNEEITVIVCVQWALHYCSALVQVECQKRNSSPARKQLQFSRLFLSWEVARVWVDGTILAKGIKRNPTGKAVSVEVMWPVLPHNTTL